MMMMSLVYVLLKEFVSLVFGQPFPYWLLSLERHNDRFTYVVDL